MRLSLSDLINKGEYWSTIALHEHQSEVLDLCKLRPVPPQGDPKVSRSTKHASLGYLDSDPTEVGR